MPASNSVYIYEELYSGVRVVGKFFNGVANRSYETAFNHMVREFNNLNYLRSIGFAGYPHYVTRPLGCNEDLNCALFEEFCWGISLDVFIIKAIREGARAALFEKLTSLTCFWRACTIELLSGGE